MRPLGKHPLASNSLKLANVIQQPIEFGGGLKMYPRNAAVPPRISLGTIIKTCRGIVQSSGVSVYIRTEGGEEVVGLGTISYGTLTNVVYYEPTQEETNHTAFVVTAHKEGCNSLTLTVVTNASPTSGEVVVMGHTPQTSDHSASIASILEDTEVIGVDGSGLTALDQSVSIASILEDTEVIGVDGSGLTALISNDVDVDVDEIATAVEQKLSNSISQLQVIHEFLGLDINNPMLISQNSHSSNNVLVTLTENLDGSITLTRGA